MLLPATCERLSLRTLVAHRKGDGYGRACRLGRESVGLMSSSGGTFCTLTVRPWKVEADQPAINPEVDEKGRESQHTGCMTFTDYLLNGLLVSLVVLQVRGRRLTAWSLMLPIAIAGYIASVYLHGIPTAGNDLYLALAGAAVGLVLGTACGMATSVFRDKRCLLMSKAGVLAASLWVAGVGSRIAFSLYVQNGGAAEIGRFSVTHQITTGQAWVACLVLMGMMEVAGRTAVLAIRMLALKRGGSDHILPSPRPAVAGTMMDLDGGWS